MTSLSADNDIPEAVKVAASLVAAADQNCERLKSLPGHVLGVQALTHRIQTERNVLIKGCKRPRWLKLEHVISSNLHHLGAVVQLATALSDKVDAVLKKYRDNSSNMPVFVDVVANGGLLWMKVVCRCPNTLQLAHCTGGRAGERAPLHQAKTLLSLASQHPVLYSTPKVAFIFCKGVSQTVYEALQKEGVIVCAPFVLPDSILPASRYLPQDDDDVSLASDSDFEAALINNSNVHMPSCDMDFVLYGTANGVGKLSKGNSDFNNGDMIVKVCDSASRCDDKNLRQCDHSDTSLCKNFNNECLGNFNRSKILAGFLDSSSDDDRNDSNSARKFKENPTVDPHIEQHTDENDINSNRELNRNEGYCIAYEKGVVLKSVESVLELCNTSSKKQWPLCSNDEMVEIARALRDYADKSDWARKAKKSETFVSLCRNSHYIGSQFETHSFNNDLSNYLENEPLNNLAKDSLKDSVDDSASLIHESGLLNSQEGSLESCLCPQTLLKTVNGTSRQTLHANPLPQTNCDRNDSDQCRNSSTHISSTAVLPNAFNSKTVDLPLKLKENSLTSGVEHPRTFSAGKILETAVVDVNKSSKLHGTLRPAEGLQPADAVAARIQVCLDVPTMIAYIANTSNGFSHCHFKDGFLRQQALWEQEEPIKPVIEKYWQDCEVLVCKEALKRFESIVGVMAGEQELRRARDLVNCVTVVPDHDELKGVLRACGGITISSRIIFGTALHHKAPLITANRRFVRSARTQGVSVAALLHNPRALTEQKQLLSVGCDTPLGGMDLVGDFSYDSPHVPSHVPASQNPFTVHINSRKRSGVGGKAAGDARKQVLSCLSSARYLSTVTPVSLLSSD